MAATGMVTRARGKSKLPPALWNDRWQLPDFRSGIRVLTAVWGVAPVAEAVIRLALALILPVPVFLITSPVLVSAGIRCPLSWTMWYRRRRPVSAPVCTGR